MSSELPCPNLENTNYKFEFSLFYANQNSADLIRKHKILSFSIPRKTGENKNNLKPTFNRTKDVKVDAYALMNVTGTVPKIPYRSQV